MNITAPIGASGRYKIIKVRDGLDVEESQWNDNAFLPGGIAFMLHDGANTITCGVSGLRTINKSPIFSWFPIDPKVSRTSTALVSASTTRNNSPDASGNLLWRTTYRFSFPAAPDQPLCTLTQGFIDVESAVPVLVPGGTAATARMSEADLIGTQGEEAEYLIDMETESFDVVWEFTEYVAAEQFGTSVVLTWKGEEVIGTSYVSWRVTPANFGNTADTAKGWLPVEDTRDFPAMRAGGATVGAGTIGNVTEQPTFTDTLSNKSVSLGSVVMTPDVSSNVAAITLNLGVDEEMLVNVARFRFGHFDFQCEFDPPIDKKKTQEMDLSFTVSIHNRG